MTGNKPNIFLFFPAAPILAATLLSLACSKHSGTPGATTRTYRMGFATSAPRPVLNEIVQSLNMWTTHADAAIISTEVPWDSLLNGENPVTYVMDNYGALLNIYRGKSMKVWVYIDPENGLNRQSDSDPLVALGLSIAQPAIQQVYRRFVVVMDSILQPDHLGLALETNLIRFAAPDSIYQGVKQAANAAAADVRAVDNKVPLSVSVQAEVAWGMLGGANTGYVGIATDLTDFPFLHHLQLARRDAPELLLATRFRPFVARLCLGGWLDIRKPHLPTVHSKQPRPTAGLYPATGSVAGPSEGDRPFPADLYRPLPLCVACHRFGRIDALRLSGDGRQQFQSQARIDDLGLAASAVAASGELSARAATTHSLYSHFRKKPYLNP
jgi:hypothetical protein